MDKKAQGISINIVIIAAIALIVLVVLIAIFTGRLSGFVTGVESCTDKSGECVEYTSGGSTADACGMDKAPLRGTDCKTTATGKSSICCVTIKK